MAAAPDDDARRTLAELEAKLRELERELLRGRDPEPPPPAAQPPAAEPAADAPPEPPAAEPEPLAAEPLAAEPLAAEPFPDAELPAEPLSPEPFPEAPPSEHEALPALGEPLGAAAEPFPEAPPSEHDALRPHGDPLGAAAEPFPEAEPPHAEPFPEAPASEHDALRPHGDPLGAAAEATHAKAFAAEPPAPAEPPPPTLDLDALADAHELLDALRATIDDLGETAGRINVEARAVVEGHGRSLARLELAARAAARAEEAAAEAGRVAGTVVIEAGPFADPGPLLELRDALAAHPGTKDAYVRGVEDGRAVIEVHLAPPPA